MLQHESNRTHNEWFVIRRNAESEIFDHAEQRKAHLNRSKAHSDAYTRSAAEWQIDGTIAHTGVVESVRNEGFWFGKMLWISVECNGEFNSLRKRI